MAITRRSLLTGLAAVPATRLLSIRHADGLAEQDAGPYINILLHGLFLMEFNEKNLIIATPQYKHHEFWTRRHGGAFMKMDEYITMYELLKPGPLNKFKPENLQFPASDVGTGYLIDYKNPTSHKHRCTMVLPWPYDIKPLRLDKKTKFKEKAKPSKITTDILSTRSDYLATITCLQYEPQTGVTPFVVNYYAEHRQPNVKVKEVNKALKAARSVCGEKFNLQMKDLATAADFDTQFPDGVTKDDEYALGEESPKAVDVASCPQFGINP